LKGTPGENPLGLDEPTAWIPPGSSIAAMNYRAALRITATFIALLNLN
tara:strand:- start:616 stop:759 length:144 start_codon:yes stop_codon:yes gene_type:complete